MLSRTSKYGVSSVLYLSLHTSINHLIGVKELATQIKVSAPMLSKTLQQLTKNKLIESKKGRNGGFFMTQEQKAKKLMYVIRILEQSDRLINDCMLGQKSCLLCDLCPYNEKVSAIRSELRAIYETDTILETARKIEAKIFK